MAPVFLILCLCTVGLEAVAKEPLLFPPLQQPSSALPQLADANQAGKISARILSAAIAKVSSSGDADERQVEPAIAELEDHGDEKEIEQHLFSGAKLFNEASSQTTEEQRAAEDALQVAMQSPSHIGKPDRALPNKMASEIACLPDFFQCPKTWKKQGVLCFAPANYSGKCSTILDLSDMDAEQKEAVARQCNLEFECQEECVQDFRQTCPSLWTEIGPGICSAPPQYCGPCSHRVLTKDMSDKEKYLFSIECHARWQCTPPSPHQYDDACPHGWELQSGQVCAAPKAYKGPCDTLAHMSGMSVYDKKMFEATCDVRWPEGQIDCVHDYSAKCPFGWFQSSACMAPVAYDTCGKIQNFNEKSPSEKADWAAMCEAKFPCKDRDTCEKEWAAPCPADWFAINGGAACVRPSSYSGVCASVLHGLVDLSLQQKQVVADTCGFTWPCKSEA
eukprot:12431514-Karenia_brevis.AAC.1